MDQRKNEARKLREKGLSYRKIGEAIGVTASTIYRWLNPEAEENARRYRKEHKEENKNYYKKWYQQHKEEQSKKKAEYYKKHQAEIRKRVAKYYAAHKAEIAAKRQEWYKHHKDEINKKRREDPKTKEKARIRARKYYYEHREEQLKKRRRYYEKNKTKILKRNAEWHKKNKAQIAVYNARHKAKRRLKEREDLSELTDAEKAQIDQIYRLAKEGKRLRCYICGKLIPKGHRHVDHIIPLSRGGKHEPSNLAITCDKCNLSKSTKTPQEIGMLL